MKKKLLSIILMSITLTVQAGTIASAQINTSTSTPTVTSTSTPTDTDKVSTNSAIKSNLKISSSSIRSYSSSSSFAQYGYVGYGFNTSGNGVYRVQSFLHGFCYFVSNDDLYDCGDIDGIWGPKTESAIIHFQQYSHLVDDGIVGPATWAEIDKWNCNHGI